MVFSTAIIADLFPVTRPLFSLYILVKEESLAKKKPYPLPTV